MEMISLTNVILVGSDLRNSHESFFCCDFCTHLLYLLKNF